MLVVADAAQWRVLAICPLAIRVSVFGVAPIAVSACTKPAVHAWTLEYRGVVSNSQDLHRCSVLLPEEEEDASKNKQS